MLALNNGCPQRTTVFRWYRKFKRNNFTLNNAETEGRIRAHVAEQAFLLWGKYLGKTSE